MGCIFAVFGGVFPRLATLFIWLARPSMFSAAFNDSFILPVLGIIFLPLTTLFYVIFWSPGGLVGWEWFWLFLALLLDIMHYFHTGYQNREYIPGYADAWDQT